MREHAVKIEACGQKEVPRWLHCDTESEGNPSQASGDRSRLWLTDGISLVPPGIQKSQNPKRQIWKVSIWCEKENHSPLLSKEDENVTNMLSTSVNLIPNLVTRKKTSRTFWNLNLNNIPVDTARWCRFTRDCMWAFHMSRSVETCT